MRGGRNGVLVFSEYSVFSLGRQILEMDGGDGCMAMRIYLMPQNCMLSND